MVVMEMGNSCKILLTAFFGISGSDFLFNSLLHHNLCPDRRDFNIGIEYANNSDNLGFWEGDHLVYNLGKCVIGGVPSLTIKYG